MDTEKFVNMYKEFLHESKTERLCSNTIVQQLQADGFVDLSTMGQPKTGDRFYTVIKGKTILAAVVGTQPQKLRIIGSHIDSPKLDLKCNPFYDKENMLMISLHDYGMIKPYQWVNTPLELHGIIFLKNGKEVDISLDSPVFSVSDIPPHIARDQMKQPMEEGFNVAQLNAIGGCLDGNDKQVSIGEKILALLKETYGIEKDDFACADLCLLPHNEPMDVGFDKALIGAYGQDDRICAFTSLQALLGCKEPKKTAVCFFVDKEEVASTGDTSAQSFALRNFARRYCSLFKAPYDADNLLEQAEALSADVTTAFDPNFPDKFDATNHACLGKGIVIEKAGAAGSGKFRANEARAEYMQVIRTILTENSIAWQTGALAKLGIGGGGTIAPFLSRYGLDCVDAGPCLLSMHSPFELSSKFDLISTYQLYKHFFLS